eukprot:2583946-Alexandrium_andersonii.AAC.1
MCIRDRRVRAPRVEPGRSYLQALRPSPARVDGERDEGMGASLGTPSTVEGSALGSSTVGPSASEVDA